MSAKKTATADVLGDELLRAIAQRGGVRSGPANVVLVSEDDRSDALYSVLSGRIARLLRRLAREEDGVLRLPEKLTRQDIGERVGSSREMVSRILKPLRIGGYIELLGGRSTLLKKLPARW